MTVLRSMPLVLVALLTTHARAADEKRLTELNDTLALTMPKGTDALRERVIAWARVLQDQPPRANAVVPMALESKDGAVEAAKMRADRVYEALAEAESLRQENASPERQTAIATEALSEYLHFQAELSHFHGDIRGQIVQGIKDMSLVALSPGLMFAVFYPKLQEALGHLSTAELRHAADRFATTWGFGTSAVALAVVVLALPRIPRTRAYLIGRTAPSEYKKATKRAERAFWDRLRERISADERMNVQAVELEASVPTMVFSRLDRVGQGLTGACERLLGEGASGR